MPNKFIYFYHYSIKLAVECSCPLFLANANTTLYPGADRDEERYERGGDDCHEEPDLCCWSPCYERDGKTFVKILFISLLLSYQAV